MPTISPSAWFSSTTTTTWSHRPWRPAGDGPEPGVATVEDPAWLALRAVVPGATVAVELAADAV
ncbi:MAG: hypothetical protein ABJA87_07900 [bacterium]